MNSSIQAHRKAPPGMLRVSEPRADPMQHTVVGDRATPEEALKLANEGTDRSVYDEHGTRLGGTGDEALRESRPPQPTGQGVSRRALLGDD